MIGRLADVANTGDHGSSDVHAPEVVTPLQGLRAALPGAAISHVAVDDPAAAAEAARAADVAVVIVGYTADDEGEYIGPDAMEDPGLIALFPSADGVAPASSTLWSTRSAVPGRPWTRFRRRGATA